MWAVSPLEGTSALQSKGIQAPVFLPHEGAGVQEIAYMYLICKERECHRGENYFPWSSRNPDVGINETRVLLTWLLCAAQSITWSPPCQVRAHPWKPQATRGKNPLKTEWQGETGNYVWPWIILRANLSKECGLNPQMHEVHECSLLEGLRSASP